MVIRGMSDKEIASYWKEGEMRTRGRVLKINLVEMMYKKLLLKRKVEGERNII